MIDWWLRFLKMVMYYEMCQVGTISINDFRNILGLPEMHHDG